MGDQKERKNAAMSRLRNNLKKKRESFADQFDFKMFICLHFKEDKKERAMFEVAEVLPDMANNYEHSILREAKNGSYSVESSLDLFKKDIVQFHAHRWVPMRKDVIGVTDKIDFFLWPRNDIESVRCHMFSRWKGEDGPFKPLGASFEISRNNYEKQLAKLLLKSVKKDMIVTNIDQSVFLFVDKQHMESANNKVMVYKLRSVCLNMPQDQLMSWSAGTMDDLLNPLMDCAAETDDDTATEDAIEAAAGKCSLGCARTDGGNYKIVWGEKSSKTK